MGKDNEYGQGLFNGPGPMNIARLGSIPAKCCMSTGNPFSQNSIDLKCQRQNCIIGNCKNNMRGRGGICGRRQQRAAGALGVVCEEQGLESAVQKIGIDFGKILDPTGACICSHLWSCHLDVLCSKRQW